MVTKHHIVGNEPTEIQTFNINYATKPKCQTNQKKTLRKTKLHEKNVTKKTLQKKRSKKMLRKKNRY